MLLRLLLVKKNILYFNFLSFMIIAWCIFNQGLVTLRYIFRSAIKGTNWVILIDLTLGGHNVPLRNIRIKSYKGKIWPESNNYRSYPQKCPGLISQIWSLPLKGPTQSYHCWLSCGCDSSKHTAGALASGLY